MAAVTGTAPSQPALETQKPLPGAGRLVSLDAYRGFIMIVLAAHGFGLAALIKEPNWSWLGAQFDHVEWTGMHFWDLIQPAFMFMVGVAMPFAFASRRARGAGPAQILRHVAWRAAMLIVWSQVLIYAPSGRLGFQLINVLAQIAFTYLLCYLILQLEPRGQIAAAALILGAHWALFALFPGSQGAFSKADNIGAVIDHWVGLKYSGYYVTINFVSSTITTLFGAWTGQFLMRPQPHARRVQRLAAATVACWAAGLALAPVNPMVKRIWTASFTLFSAGWVLALLLAFYWMVEVRGWRKPVFPLVVVGMNSLFIYSLSMLQWGWLNRAVGTFTFQYRFLGTFAPVAQATTVVLVMWYCCYWLYQRKIFFKF